MHLMLKKHKQYKPIIQQQCINETPSYTMVDGALYGQKFQKELQIVKIDYTYNPGNSSKPEYLVFKITMGRTYGGTNNQSLNHKNNM